MQIYLSFDTNVHGLFDFVLRNYKQAMQGQKFKYEFTWKNINVIFADVVCFVG